MQTSFLRMDIMPGQEKQDEAAHYLASATVSNGPSSATAFAHQFGPKRLAINGDGGRASPHKSGRGNVISPSGLRPHRQAFEPYPSEASLDHRRSLPLFPCLQAPVREDPGASGSRLRCFRTTSHGLLPACSDHRWRDLSHMLAGSLSPPCGSKF